ncbi:hypothetical protein GF407_02555 [candidate division KSB1 bacterium]|nr:hypothetical protein [candidate division KSB1 bacterium]
MINFSIALLLSSAYLPAAENALPSPAVVDSLTRASFSFERHTPDSAYKYVRGLERQAKPGFKSVNNAIMFLPGLVIDGVRSATAFGMHLVNDPEIRARINSFVESENKSFRWYPVADITSDYRPRIGADFFIPLHLVDMAFNWNFAGREKYKLAGNISYHYKNQPYTWRCTLSGLFEHDDDRKFYGIGVTPRNDRRNAILPSAAADYGIYKEKRRKIQLVSSIGFHSHLSLSYSALLQKRTLRNAPTSENAIGNLFNLDKMKEFKHPVQPFYHELSIRLDSRRQERYLSSGIKFEIYYGRSKGIGQDSSTFSRCGFDFMMNIPILDPDRLLTPRLVYNRIKNNSLQTAIPFTEYPQQPVFRGVSGLYMLRTDNHSFVPSLEYHWPLTYYLGAHLFIDYLLVSDQLSHLSWTRVPWAIGLGADIHAKNKELARGYIAAGSEGFHLTFTIGLDSVVNSRSAWE